MKIQQQVGVNRTLRKFWGVLSNLCACWQTCEGSQT